MDAFTLERFKQLPQSPDRFFIGGVLTDEDFAPALVEAEAGARIAMWIGPPGVSTPVPRLVRPGEDIAESLFDALVDWVLAKDGPGFRPVEVRFSDPTLADTMRPRLLTVGIPCAVCDMFDRLRERLVNEVIAPGEWLPPRVSGPLTGRNVTVEHMRSFAEAGRLYYNAAPWTQLTNEDLIEVRHPKPPAGFRYVCVLGDGEDVYGAAFFRTVRDFAESLNGADLMDAQELTAGKWCLMYCGADRITEDDADLWAEHQLPLSDAGKYPIVLMCDPTGDFHRPAARQLEFITGLLHALAATSPADLDAEEWTAHSPGNDGPVEYQFRMVPTETLNHCIPLGIADLPENLRRHLEGALARADREMERRNLRSPKEVERRLEILGDNPFLSNAITPLEQAQDVMYEAWAERGRRRRRMAEKALAICPDCVDAYVALAEAKQNDEQAVELYRKGLDAGERSLVQDEIEQLQPGDLWTLVRARSFLRALAGLAHRLCRLGRYDEAVKHYRRSLWLDAEDHHGARYHLAGCLLQLGRDRELRKVIDEYGDPHEAYWLYLDALMVYRMEGDTPLARKRRAQAVRANRLVADVLLDRLDDLPDDVGGESDGDGSVFLHEADDILELVAERWVDTPGALDWLGKQKPH